MVAPIILLSATLCNSITGGGDDDDSMMMLGAIALLGASNANSCRLTSATYSTSYNIPKTSVATGETVTVQSGEAVTGGISTGIYMVAVEVTATTANTVTFSPAPGSNIAIFDGSCPVDLDNQSANASATSDTVSFTADGDYTILIYDSSSVEFSVTMN